MSVLLPGLAVLLTAALGFQGGGRFAPTAAAPIPIALAVAALASAGPRSFGGDARSRNEPRADAVDRSTAERPGGVSGNPDRRAAARPSLASEVAEVARRAKAAREAAVVASEWTHRVDAVSRAATASLEALERQVIGARGAVIGADATTRALDGLAAQASEIGEIIALIQSIAARTNVLALNATIEAARAGEAGRGFAGVARDVKALACQTERATGRIAERIAALQRAAAGAVEAVATIGAATRQAEELTETVATAMRSQVVGMKDMPRGAARAAVESALAVGTLDHLGRQLGRADAALAKRPGAVAAPAETPPEAIRPIATS